MPLDYDPPSCSLASSYILPLSISTRYRLRVLHTASSWDLRESRDSWRRWFYLRASRGRVWALLSRPLSRFLPSSPRGPSFVWQCELLDVFMTLNGLDGVGLEVIGSL